MNTSRRSFLKVASLTAFALGTLPTTTLHATQKTPGTYKKSKKALLAKRWAMVIDTRAFTTDEDFQKIIDACHYAHNVPNITGNQDIKWIWSDTYNHVFPDDSNPYLPEYLLQKKFLALCNHCSKPPCVDVCPTGATFKNNEGLVVMDPHRCIGCRFCMAGCPYGARSFNYMDPEPFIKNVNPKYPMRTRGVVEKCTFCPERLAVGKLPACVEASNGAILFGDLDDPDSIVRQTLTKNFTIQRKPNLGTEPGIYYII